MNEWNKGECNIVILDWNCNWELTEIRRDWWGVLEAAGGDNLDVSRGGKNGVLSLSFPLSDVEDENLERGMVKLRERHTRSYKESDGCISLIWVWDVVRRSRRRSKVLAGDALIDSSEAGKGPTGPCGWVRGRNFADHTGMLDFLVTEAFSILLMLFPFSLGPGTSVYLADVDAVPPLLNFVPPTGVFWIPQSMREYVS